MRASLRHGLPYRWWASEALWVGLIAGASVAVFVVLLGLVLLGWFEALP